ncbi:hypothetical protein Q8V59_004206 [Vibrio vulnificus]|nr:hypothetical protein [Vibrio vulnificus]
MKYSNKEATQIITKIRQEFIHNLKHNAVDCFESEGKHSTTYRVLFNGGVWGDLQHWRLGGGVDHWNVTVHVNQDPTGRIMQSYEFSTRNKVIKPLIEALMMNSEPLPF